MADFALQTNGSSNYIACGTLGTLGAAMANGIYTKFLIKTTSTALGECGFVHTSQSSGFIIGFNEGPINTNTNGAIEIDFEDASGTTKRLRGHTGTVGFNDGNVHTIEISAPLPGTIITVNVDGVSKPITYENQDTLVTFANFNASWDIGARYFNGGIGNFFAATFDDFQIGVNSGSIYGNFQMDEGAGTITANTGLAGGNGTLTGSPAPSWVTGLGSIIATYTPHNLGLLGIGS